MVSFAVAMNRINVDLVNIGFDVDLVEVDIVNIPFVVAAMSHRAHMLSNYATMLFLLVYSASHMRRTALSARFGAS